MKPLIASVIGLLSCGLAMTPASAFAQVINPFPRVNSSVASIKWQTLPALGQITFQEAHVDYVAVTANESVTTNLAATRSMDGIELVSIASGEESISLDNPTQGTNAAVSVDTGPIKLLGGLVKFAALQDSIELNVLTLVAEGDVLIPDVTIGGVSRGPVAFAWSDATGAGRPSLDVSGPVQRTVVNALGLVILKETLTFTGKITFGTTMDASNNSLPAALSHPVAAELRGRIDGGIFSPAYNVAIDVGDIQVAQTP